MLNPILKKCFKAPLLLFLILLPLSYSIGAAEEEEQAAEEKEPLLYFAIQPKTLTFYQNTGKKIKYVVVQVEVAVRGQDNFDLVEENLPLLQDALVDYFNSQDKSTIEDLKQRRALQNGAKDKLAAILKEETGKDLIEDLLFTDYLYQ